MSQRGVKTNPVLDEITIAEFLEQVIGRDWFHLYSIDPRQTKAKPRGYVAQSIADACDWARDQETKGRNLYCALNPPKQSQTRKALREEVLWLCFLHADIDADVARDGPEWDEALLEARELARQLNIQGEPAIVATGNGAQALWPLAEPLRATPANQALVTWYNRRINAGLRRLASSRVKIDSLANIDRIVRLAGSVNYPNEVKRNKNYRVEQSSLIQVQSREFELDDFNKLPNLPMVVDKSDVKRIDYGLRDYRDWANPYRWREFMAEYPDTEWRLSAVLESGESSYDRSRAAYGCLMALCEFVERKEELTPEQVYELPDARKNIFDMFMEGVDDERTPSMAAIASHYEENANGWSQLGYDLGATLKQRMEEGRDGNSQGAVRRMERRADIHQACTAPEDTVTAGGATKAFLGYVSSQLTRNDLPNCIGGDNPSPSQLPTLANVAAVLDAAMITPRWNLLTDDITFRIHPDAGTTGPVPYKPAFHFERALGHVAATVRADREMQLVLDALAELGIRDRAQAEKHLVSLGADNPYHPFEEWVMSKPWDGRDRYAQLADCLVSMNPLKLQYLRVHVRSCVAVIKSFRRWLVLGTGVALSSAVVLIGPQGIGKSRFWNATIPPEFKASGSSLQLGSHGEADSKASCLRGVLCVLNELGQTFDRSKADALKDFVSQETDNYRIAYGRKAMVRPRMTVFASTANEDFSLRDATGNRRYLCLDVAAVDFASLDKLDLQQLYAQAWREVMQEGAEWWLSDEKAAERDRQNERFRAITEPEAAARDYLMDEPEGCREEWLTCRQVCEVLGVKYTPQAWHLVRKVLTEQGLEYRDRVKRKAAPTLRDVWGFPVQPEIFQAVRAVKPRR